MKKGLLYLAVVLFSLCTLGACKEEDDTYDAYANWPARNAEFFSQIAAEARDSIAQAKKLYGNQWEAYCNWRMFKSTTKSQNILGALTDSICVYIEQRGSGTDSPTWSDTVRVNYRGYLMPTQNMVNGEWWKNVRCSPSLSWANWIIRLPCRPRWEFRVPCPDLPQLCNTCTKVMSGGYIYPLNWLTEVSRQVRCCLIPR